jgi:hypothetical protein
MTEFNVDTAALNAYAGELCRVGAGIQSGAADTLAGVRWMDFGIVVGPIIGLPLQKLAEHMAESMRNLAQSVSGTGDGVAANATFYGDTETYLFDSFRPADG